jgi:hypothetical protein
MTPENVRLEFSKLATQKQFSIFARRFFGRFTTKCLDYFVSRALAQHLGEGRRFTTLAEQSEFSNSLKTHCREASKILESYSGEWFSKANWRTPNNATDVWSVKKVNPQSMVHLTEKPVELAVRAIQYSSRSGENVLDLFGGSGSTLIACEQTGRKAFLMELDPLYCDVIVERWEKFTGKKAERIPVAEAAA